MWGMGNAYYYYCKNCKVETVKDDPVRGYAVCTQCGLVNHDDYFIQSLESIACSTKDSEMPNDEHRDHWLVVMKVPATLVNKLYTELENVKYGNIQDELIGLAYLSEIDMIKFDWRSVANSLGLQVEHISKKVNQKLSKVDDGVLDMLSKYKRNLKEEQYEKAVKLATKAINVTREPRVIVAGILAQVTKNPQWYVKLEVSIASKRAIIQDLEKVDSEYEPLAKRQRWA